MPGSPVMLLRLLPVGTLAGSTMTWQVHGSWMQRSGAFCEHVKLVGHEVAHGGINDWEQAAVATLRSSSTQMLRLHTHGSTMQTKFQSGGHADGLGPHWALLEAGQLTPGQAADPLKGTRHWLMGMGPLEPVSVNVQLLHPSIVQLVILVPLQSTVLQIEAAAGEHA